jgi:6-phosphogluconolactonase
MGLWVGSYGDAGGGGLYPAALEAGAVRVETPVSAIANASFGVWCKRRRIAYFVNEQAEGQVTGWRSEEGRWHKITSSSSGGSMPCYLALHPSGSMLAVANYDEGSVGIIAVDEESGGPGAVIDIKRVSGRGYDPERQEGSHAHCALFSEDGRWLYHVDLGLDRVLRYPVAEKSIGEAEIAFEARPGSGPRHLLLHPNGRHALLLCELSGELLLLERGAAHGFSCLQIERTLPESVHGENLGGHLAIDPLGKGVLVSNRGHDSLVAFDLEDSRLSMRGWAVTGGKSPRHFWTDGKIAMVAHEESGTVALVPVPAAGTERGLSTACAAVPGAAFVMELEE